MRGERITKTDAAGRNRDTDRDSAQLPIKMVGNVSNLASGRIRALWNADARAGRPQYGVRAPLHEPVDTRFTAACPSRRGPAKTARDTTAAACPQRTMESPLGPSGDTSPPCRGEKRGATSGSRGFGHRLRLGDDTLAVVVAPSVPRPRREQDALAREALLVLAARRLRELGGIAVWTLR
ncbi:MAG TPA: hypothetical protein VKM93_18955 [Terriglobia bacterium]|nr:hypothetical protein [Terriglobia bacterium]